METWKPVVGWEGIYEVSDLGRVRRISPSSGTQPGKILRLRLTEKGYHNVALCRHSVAKNYLVHRLVAAAFVGPPPPDKPEINHRDGDPTNNVPANLEYTDRSGNNLHAYRVLGRKTTVNAGEDHHNAKLTHDQANEIRRIYEKTGQTQRQIASQFGISSALVSMIIQGKAWTGTRGQFLR